MSATVDGRDRRSIIGRGRGKISDPVTAAWVLGVLIALAACGCSSTDDAWLLRPRGLPTHRAPMPDSPAAALRTFEWSYNNKAISEYRELFTADFRFLFSPLDSAGVAYRDVPWNRDDELISTSHLFLGGSANQPTASSIRLALDRNVLVYPDPRYAQWDAAGRWHVTIRTQAFLSIKTEAGTSVEVSGGANFYLVRGDSAMIPADLVARGFRADSTRWWIARWDDETMTLVPGAAYTSRGARVVLGSAPLAVQPASNKTWGSIKVLYR